MIKLRRNRFLMLATLYALAMVYSSLVLGPLGLHYVPLGLDEAWDKFTSVRFASNGSDQRPDWIANMLLSLPLAFLINSAIGWRSEVTKRVAGIVATLAVTFVLVLAMKYAQLFFPPRTVTLNYIAAQLIGAVLGVIVFEVSHTKLYPNLLNRFDNGEGLNVVLGAYTFLLIAYYLIPFDIILSLGDLAARARKLLSILFSIPGDGHQPAHLLLVVTADTLTAVPVGMYLALVGHERTTHSLILRGFGLMCLIFIAQIFVIGTNPLLVALIYRTAGIAVGILLIQWIRGKDLRKRHYYFSRYLPLVFPVYLVLVMFVCGILNNNWITLDEAVDTLEPRQLLPFWNFYIVTKAHAAKSFVVGFLMFAPIGVMVWLWRGFSASGAKLSAILALTLSLAMELSRMLKPGLRPDFSDPIIAAIAAAVTFKAMPFLWRMFESEAARSGTLDSHIVSRDRFSPR